MIIQLFTGKINEEISAWQKRAFFHFEETSKLANAMDCVRLSINYTPKVLLELFLFEGISES